MGGEDPMDDNNAFTPSASTEDYSRPSRPSNTTKNEYDLDMEDEEETKEDRTSMPNQVPVEDFNQASKSLGIEMHDNKQRMETMPAMISQKESGGHSMQRRQSDQAGADPFNETASKRAATSRQASIDTHVDIAAIDDEARRLSW